MKVYGLLFLALVACTKRNPAVCCLTETDCAEADLGDIRECAAGLACVDYQCVVPTCSMTGCEATTPVCNITTDVCEGCSDSSHCSRFAETDVCNTADGACVECVTANDCDSSKPICDANACRACTLDSECLTGACGDDGRCVPEASVVYLDPTGTDAGTCTRSSPCRRLSTGVAQTTALRDHIVMAPGDYTELVWVTPQSTPAARLYIHGAGARLSQPPGSVEATTLRLSVPATIRNVDVRTEAGGQALALEVGASVVEHVVVRGGGGAGISIGPSASLRDVRIEDVSTAISAVGGGHLDAERLTIARAFIGIYLPNSSVNITNVLIHGTTSLAMQLTGGTGVVSFATIADAGGDTGMGPRAVDCGPSLMIRSSIIWAPNAARAITQGCNLSSTIVGPLGVPGAMNVNPAFVASGDYHLSPGSPARDLVEVGPATDIEGSPRPRGARFDIGAYEAMP